MSETSDARAGDERDAPEREAGLNPQKIAEDAAKRFDKPAKSAAADSDVPPPG